MLNDPFKEWNINDQDFPETGTNEEKLEFLLGYAILAPSGHNTQPWLFRYNAGGIDIFADRTRHLPAVDPDDRALIISCGAALGHFRTAIRYFGFEGDIAILPNPTEPDLLAHVTLGPRREPTEIERARFRAIKMRRTTRLSYRDEPLPQELSDDLIEGVSAEGAELAVIVEDHKKSPIASLVAQGDRIQFADPAFRAELASWVHSRRAASRDGMSGANFGMPDILSAVGALVIRTFDMGDGQAASHEAIATHSPALLVIATREDTPGDWIAAGLALSNVLLTVTAAGWTSAYLNQPIEVAKLRPLLAQAAGVAGQPQLLLRIGRADDIKPAVRRPVGDVLLTQVKIAAS
jgi:Nitroreductase family